jgi:beta-lactamase regulating signal transducer with metallopeptidase domain
MVKRWLARSTLGEGPERSLIVGGCGVVVAAAGLRSPKIVVSTGALLRLDDDELRAGLQHEWGHVVRRHRYISLFGQGCRAVSRFVPGGAAALRALELHLERDADDYAVRRTGNRLALASAICKAAGADIGGAAAVTALGGSGVPERLRQLVRSPARPRRLNVLAARALAAAMLAVTLALAAAGPTLAAAGIDQLAKSSGNQVHHCH